MFQPSAESVRVRQDLRDTGHVLLEPPGHEGPIHLPCKEGPGRPLSTFVRIVVSNLPAEFMMPGVIRSLLNSAGYEPGSTERVFIRAEHGGELMADMAAFAPGVMRLGVVVGIVCPPASDTGPRRLPRAFQDCSGEVTIQVAGHKLPQPPQQQMDHRAPVFVPVTAQAHDQGITAPA